MEASGFSVQGHSEQNFSLGTYGHIITLCNVNFALKFVFKYFYIDEEKICMIFKVFFYDSIFLTLLFTLFNFFESLENVFALEP